MTDRVLSMEFEANFRNVDLARAALQGIGSDCFGRDLERAADIVLAASEAMNNAVEHTASTTVKLEVAWNGKRLRVSVLSDGPPFDPVTAAAELNQEDMLGRSEGGYGLYLIRELVDSFEYEYRDALNIWKMSKYTDV